MLVEDWSPYRGSEENAAAGKVGKHCPTLAWGLRDGGWCLSLGTEFLQPEWRGTVIVSLLKA